MQYKSAANLIRVNHFSCGPTYRFVHPRHDAAVEAGSVDDLNAVLVELGYCPVFEYHPGKFADITRAMIAA